MILYIAVHSNHCSMHGMTGIFCFCNIIMLMDFLSVANCRQTNTLYVLTCMQNYFYADYHSRYTVQCSSSLASLECCSYITIVKFRSSLNWITVISINQYMCVSMHSSPLGLSFYINNHAILAELWLSCSWLHALLRPIGL